MWYLSFWERSLPRVAVAHGHGPDAARHPSDHRVLGVHAVGEEEDQVGGEVVDVHAPRQVRLHVGEAVGQGEGELGDRVRPGLGDVVAGDGHRVEVAHPALAEVLLDVAHHPQRELGGEDAGVLGLVLLEDVGLDGAADHGHGLGQDPPYSLVEQARHRVPASAVAPVGLERILPVIVETAARTACGADLTGDGGVEEEGQDGRRRTVDGHGHRGRGVAQVEAGVELLHVLDGAHRDAALADLAVDVGPPVRVLAVEGHGVEGRGQALGGLAVGQVVEALVGAGGPALAGEHAGRVLLGALEGEHAGGVGELSGDVLQEEVAQDRRPVGVGAAAPSGSGPRQRRRGRGTRISFPRTV